MVDWSNQRKEIKNKSADYQTEVDSYFEANSEMIVRTMRGLGPDSTTSASGAGMRLVYNIASAHVGSLLRETPVSQGGKPYLNCYDAKKQLGVRKVGKLRREIDKVVADAAGGAATPENTYYGAVELNGAGLRYFGDFCLVLKPEERSDFLIITNSYDLHRAPVRERVYVFDDKRQTETNRKRAILEWGGRWPVDAADMAAVKILRDAPVTRSRLTTGVVSAAVLSDESYLEVARIGSFGAAEIDEIRVSAADAGAEAQIADRIMSGPAPGLVEYLWRHRRRGAERAAKISGIQVRVVVTQGRDRG